MPVLFNWYVGNYSYKVAGAQTTHERRPAVGKGVKLSKGVLGFWVMPFEREMNKWKECDSKSQSWEINLVYIESLASTEFIDSRYLKDEYILIE